VPTEVQRGRHNAGPERPRLAQGYEVSLLCRIECVVPTHLYAQLGMVIRLSQVGPRHPANGLIHLCGGQIADSAGWSSVPA
jgi:hypothetical protein